MRTAPGPISAGGGEPGTSDGPAGPARLRIGEAAQRAGVSTRTLRYYQELGLLTPAATTVGGARRYADADVARILRIRHLTDLVGLDLSEVGRVLGAEDRLASIRRQWWDSQTSRRRSELLDQAFAINDELSELVSSKMAGLREFQAGLQERAALLRRRQEELRAQE